MPEKKVFDDKAENYDEEFTHSYIGHIQRKKIQAYISRCLLGKAPLEILELNCGTGEDVAFLQQYGTVTATDASEKMLEICTQKNPGVQVQFLDLEQPLPAHKKYDLVFSNFGGLNCISLRRMQALNDELAAILNPGGQLFFVLIHNWSLVEFAYFSSRLRFKKACRRSKGSATFGELSIHYYSPHILADMFPSFHLEEQQPIGVVLAGEYMNRLGKRLRLQENHTTWLSPVLGADHFLFNFIRR